MQLKQIFPILLLTTLFMSCESEIPATDPVFDDKLPIKQRIELAINEGLIKQMGYSEEFATSISDFYKQRNFAPVWSNDSMVTPSYVRFKHFFSQPNVIGAPALPAPGTAPVFAIHRQLNPRYERNEEFAIGFDVRGEVNYQLTKMITVRAGFQVIDLAMGIWRGGQGPVGGGAAPLGGDRNQDVVMAGGTFGITLNR